MRRVTRGGSMPHDGRATRGGNDGVSSGGVEFSGPNLALASSSLAGRFRIGPQAVRKRRIEKDSNRADYLAAKANLERLDREAPSIAELKEREGR